MRARIARAAAVIVLVAVVAAAVIDELTPHGQGPADSSYSTDASGLQGWAELLQRAGHPVVRLRQPPAEATLQPGETLVVVNPDVVTHPDIAAIRSFVRAGGNLVAGGRSADTWLSGVLPGAPTWTSSAPTQFNATVPVAQDTGVQVVHSAGQGSWSDPRGTLPVLSARGGALLTVATLGSGRISLLADASPLENGQLASADNAALAEALGGPPGRPVAFEEAVHGYGAGSGLSALPARWKWALVGLALAGLAWVASRFRRLGPPQPQASLPVPPRRAHLEALGLALSHTKSPAAAAEPVRRQARQILLRRARLQEDATPEQVRVAATGLGLSEDEAEILAAPALRDDRHAVLTAGRALANLTTEASR